MTPSRDATKLHVPIAILIGAIIMTAGVVASYFNTQLSMERQFGEVRTQIAELKKDIQALQNNKMSFR